jgi:sugar phosphate permease
MVLAILTANGASSMMWTEYCLSLRKTGMVSSATGYLDFLSYAAAAIANVIFADAATSIGWGSLILVWCALMVLGVIISLPFKKFKKEKANATNV